MLANKSEPTCLISLPSRSGTVQEYEEVVKALRFGTINTLDGLADHTVLHNDNVYNQDRATVLGP